MNIPQPPPMPAHQFNLQDESHLNLLSVFHYVLGGLYFLGIGFIVLHFMIMSTVFRMAPAMHSSSADPAPVVEIADAGTLTPPPMPTPAPEFPAEIMTFMMVFYVFFGFCALAMAIGNIMSATFIKKRKHKTFTYIISGINCLQVPFGTVLGIFTFIVLGRPSVQSAYDAKLRI